MPDQISQTIGFNAAPAIAAIEQLNAAMAKAASGVQSLGGTLSAFNAQGAQFSATMKSIASDAQRAATAMSKLGSMPKVQAPAMPTRGLVDQHGNALSSGIGATQLTQVAAAAKDADGGVKQLTVTWGTLGRVVATQAVVRALSMIRAGLSEATESAIKFGKQIAEIQTIGGEDLGGASGIAARLKDVAIKFNQPLDKTAEAYYETLSNGFTRASEADQLMADSAKLAAAGVTSLDNASNLLTATLNGYGLSANQAAQVSAKWFQGVKDGRFRVADFANSIGRLIPQAKAMGVSVDEVIASLATLTTSGVKPSEAITQVRGAMNAFAKPTTEMGQTIKALGFDTAESLIAVKGWGGALAATAAATDKTSEGLAKIAPNLRGVNTFLQIGVQNGKKYNEFLANTRKASSAMIDEKASQVLQSPSQQVSALANRAKIALTTGFGEGVVNATANLQRFVDPIKLVEDELRVLSPVLITGAGLLTVYGTAAGAAAAKNALFGASIPMAAKALTGAAVAYAVGSSLGDAISSWSQSSLNALEKLNSQELEGFTAAQKQIVEAQQQTTQERVQAIMDGAAPIYQEYAKEADAAKEANDKIVDSTMAAAQRIVSAREQLISGIGRQINDNEASIKASHKRITDLMGRSEDRSFDAFAGQWDKSHQATFQMQRAKELADEASRQLAHAKTPEEQQDALSKFARANKYGEAAAKSAQGNSYQQFAAAKALESITEKQIAAERTLQQLRSKQSASLEKERTAQQKILNDVKGAVKVLAETSSPLDVNGKLLSDDKLKANADKRAKALKTLTDSALKSKSSNLADLLGLAKLNTDLTRTPIRLKFDVEEGIADVESKMRAAFAKFKLALPVDVDALERNLGKKFRTPTEVAAGIKEAQSQLAELQEQGGRANTSNQKIAQLRTEINQVGTDAKSASRNVALWLESFAGPNESKAYSALQKVRTGYDALSKAKTVKPEQAQELFRQLGQVKKLATTGPFGGSHMLSPAMAMQIGEYARGIGKLHEVGRLQQTPEISPQAAEQAQRLQQALQGGASSVNAFARLPSALGQGASSSQRIASAFQSAAEAAQQTAEAAASIVAPSAQHKAFGGQIGYYADGGQPRGIDTVPAYLSAGEFVMNARSTRRFLPALQAMNAGLVPGHHAFGGHITNTNVGDIHVHADKSPALTAQAIKSIITRGQRRGITK